MRNDPGGSGAVPSLTAVEILDATRGIEAVTGVETEEWGASGWRSAYTMYWGGHSTRIGWERTSSRCGSSASPLPKGAVPRAGKGSAEW